ncbi:hypothetical protein ABIB25_005417 [Nakamurella sp. UYEF19]|uniref:SCO6880 family protein n=1 Tax=Nakamurella sp. UYEF19 TaxID=1756392 RepID=UPI0033937250
MSTTTITEDRTKPRTARFGRRSARGFFMGLTGAQAATVLAAVLVVAVTLAVLGVGAALKVLLLVSLPLGLVAMLRRDGVPLVEWIPIAWHFVRRRMTEQSGFRATAKPRPTASLLLPGESARLRWMTSSDGSVVVHDPWTAGYTAVVRVREPAFLLMEAESQDGQISGWGRVLAGLCQADVIRYAQVLEYCVPDSGDSLRDWWRTHGQPLNGLAGEHYEELMAVAGPVSSRSESLVAITLDGKKARALIKHAGGGHAGALSILAGQRRIVDGALTGASLAVEGWLTPEELAYELRCAYDPAIRPVLDYHPRAGRDLDDAGPLAIEEHWDYLRSDSGFHSVLWLAEWPRSAVYPTFLAPLILTPGVQRRLTLLYEPIPMRRAMRDIRMAKAELVSDAVTKSKMGQVAAISDAAEMRDVQDREAEMYAGHGDMGYAGLLSVTAPTLDELTVAVGVIRQAAIQAGCEARVLAGQQPQAFIAAALPLTKGF